jgi:hypothetical protein
MLLGAVRATGFVDEAVESIHEGSGGMDSSAALRNEDQLPPVPGPELDLPHDAPIESSGGNEDEPANYAKGSGSAVVLLQFAGASAKPAAIADQSEQQASAGARLATVGAKDARPLTAPAANAGDEEPAPLGRTPPGTEARQEATDSAELPGGASSFLLGHDPGTGDEDGEEVEAMDRLILKAARVAEEEVKLPSVPAADLALPSPDAREPETHTELSQLRAEENTPSSKRKRSAPGSGHLDAEDAAHGMVPQPSDSAAEENINTGARFVRRGATDADAAARAVGRPEKANFDPLTNIYIEEGRGAESAEAAEESTAAPPEVRLAAVPPADATNPAVESQIVDPQFEQVRTATSVGVEITRRGLVRSGNPFTSQHKRVSWNKKGKNWQAQIHHGGKNEKLSGFATEDEAKACCDARRLELDLDSDAGKSSSFRGVTWHKARSKWQVRIGIDGKMKHLGLFNVTAGGEVDAALAYDAAALAEGRSEKVNFVPTQAAESGLDEWAEPADPTADLDSICADVALLALLQMPSTFLSATETATAVRAPHGVPAEKPTVQLGQARLSEDSSEKHADSAPTIEPAAVADVRLGGPRRNADAEESANHSASQRNVEVMGVPDVMGGGALAAEIMQRGLVQVATEKSDRRIRVADLGTFPGKPSAGCPDWLTQQFFEHGESASQSTDADAAESDANVLVTTAEPADLQEQLSDRQLPLALASHFHSDSCCEGCQEELDDEFFTRVTKQVAQNGEPTKVRTHWCSACWAILKVKSAQAVDTPDVDPDQKLTIPHPHPQPWPC